uniref:NADH dehydrogenase subunit 4L n=1 Tax=Opisthoteuthis massyae TaxID=164543 RepID=UPI0022FD90C2|nr:NADH dehydrogenase subunit 4L [Opisthoteuthis massyae]WAP91457.1 NADH dehydrogenase subunit 4L [Opisthoteuthis massyae]WAP91483.1 NADH dehydrogenase subunit 4L [Opisthoteuthis massyae]
MLSNELLLSLFMYVSGLLVLLFQWKHVLNVLLSFEIMSLGMLMSFMFSWGIMSMDYFLIMVLVVFSVCEASLGLSLLVSMIRCHGNDYVKMLNLYKL